MTIRTEMLYPDIANLFGDTQNMRYLAQCLPELELTRTELNDKPAFTTEQIDMIYLGPMPEIGQQRIIERLMPYRERIAELIQSGTVFLFSGNALEVLGESIKNPEQNYEVAGLNLLPIRSEIALYGRFNCKVLGSFAQSGASADQGSTSLEQQDANSSLKIVGFKSQFSQVFGDNSKSPFLHCLRGAGLNKNSHLEGIRQQNFFGTSLLGPLLILNPLFTKYLISLLKPTAGAELAFEAEIMAAYECRLKEFEDPRTEGFDGKGH